MINTFEKVWLYVLRISNKFPVFPRDLAFFARKKVYSLFEYLNLLRVNQGKKDCGFSIFSDYQKENNLYDLIFLDFDAETLTEEVFQVVKKIYAKYSGLVIFSGKKGFHMYLPIYPMKFDIKNVRCWLKEKLFKEIPEAEAYIDCKVVGDKSRIARMPNTLHPKSLLYCIPLVVDIENISLSSVLNLAKNPVNCLFRLKPIERLTNEILDYVLNNKNLEKNNIRFDEVERLNLSFSTIILPFCLRKNLSELIETGEMGHLARFNLVCFLASMGINKNEIKKIFKYARDYNEGYTEYQINYLVENKYLCYNCENLKLLNFCPLPSNKVCIYYPNMVFRGREIWFGERKKLKN